MHLEPEAIFAHDPASAASDSAIDLSSFAPVLPRIVRIDTVEGKPTPMPTAPATAFATGCVAFVVTLGASLAIIFGS